MDAYIPVLTLSNYVFMGVLLNTYQDNCRACHVFKSFVVVATSGVVFVSVMALTEGVYMDYMALIITFMSFVTTLGISVCVAHNIRKSDIKMIFIIGMVAIIGLYFISVRVAMLLLQLGGLLIVRHAEI